jgi:hypothetical protein
MFSRFHKMKSHHQTLFAVIIAFAVISFWRGIWGLQDEYLFPESTILSLWASVFIGLAILVASGYVVKELT